MKINFLIIIFFFFYIGYSQTVQFKGRILNSETKEPIYGAAILYNNNYICFSDVDGSFQFELVKKEKIDSIKIKHLAYKSKLVDLNLFYDGQITIALDENLTSLDEIVLSSKAQKESLKTILEHAVKKFNKENRESPYWSELDYKHIIYLNGEPNAFLQLDGHIFMLGQEKDPFYNPLIVPEYIRRTKESPVLVESWFAGSSSKNFLKAQLGQTMATSSWVDYRFFEIVHPLLKKGHRYFDFALEVMDENNEDILVISFIQKKGISFHSRWLDYMQGKIWIDKEDFSLVRASVSYRFEKIYYQSFDIQYQVVQDQLFPQIIETKSYMLKSLKEGNHQIVVSSLAQFHDIDLVKRKNYRKDFVFGPWYKISETYDDDYWDTNLIKNVKYQNALFTIAKGKSLNTIFAEGSKTKEYNSNLFTETLELFNEEGQELKQIMESDLKTNEK